MRAFLLNNRKPHDPSDAHKDRPRPEKSDVARFQALLQGPLDVFPPHSAWQPSPPDEPVEKTGPPTALQHSSGIEHDKSAIPRPVTLPDSQTLFVRACSGPLAGLLVEAQWLRGRIVLRLHIHAEVKNKTLIHKADKIRACLSEVTGIAVFIGADDGK